MPLTPTSATVWQLSDELRRALPLREAAQCLLALMAVGRFAPAPLSSPARLEEALRELPGTLQEALEEIGFAETVDHAGLQWESVFPLLTRLQQLSRGFSDSELTDIVAATVIPAAAELATPPDVAAVVAGLLVPAQTLPAEEPATIYDPCCGPGTLLGTVGSRLANLGAGPVRLFGSEIHRETLVLGRLHLALRGVAPDQLGGLRLADGTEADPPRGARWITAAPPFGKDEHSPATFIQHLLIAAPQLHPHWKAAVLTSKDVLWRPELRDLRNTLFEADLVETVIALPASLLYATAIPSVLWLLARRKAPARRGSVQLVDAEDCWSPSRNGPHRKQRVVTEEHLQRILAAHREEQPHLGCRVPVRELLRREVAVRKAPGEPLRIENLPGDVDPQDWFEREVLPFAAHARLEIRDGVRDHPIRFQQFFSTSSPALFPAADLAELQDELSRAKVDRPPAEAVEGDRPWPSAALWTVATVVEGAAALPDAIGPSDVPWVEESDLRTHVVFDARRRTSGTVLEQEGIPVLPAGAVLLGLVSAELRVAVAARPVAIGDAMVAIVPGPRLHGGYLAWFLESHRDELEQAGQRGLVVPRLDPRAIESLRIPLAPRDEQAAIASRLDRQAAQLDALIGKHRRLIGLLEEYRGTLLRRGTTTRLQEERAAPQRQQPAAASAADPHDLSLAHRMLKLTPRERLEALQSSLDDLIELRGDRSLR